MFNQKDIHNINTLNSCPLYKKLSNTINGDCWNYVDRQTQITDVADHIDSLIYEGVVEICKILELDNTSLI